MKKSRSSSWFTLTVGGLTVTNIGFYATLALLSLHIVETLGFSTSESAIVLFASSFGLRFMRLVVAPVLDKIAPHVATPCATMLSIAGYLLLSQAMQMHVVALAVLLIGTGYGIHGMLVTSLTASAPEQHGSIYQRYLFMNACASFAAILGPLAGNALRLHVSSAAPFLFSAGVLCVSLMASLFLPRDLPEIRSEKHWFATAKTLLKRRSCWRAFAFVALGWALYTQKYAVIPLFTEVALQQPSWVGALVAVNATLILGISIPFGKLSAKKQWEADRIALTAFSLYGVAFALLAAVPTAWMLWCALPLWSFAEAMLMPALNTLIAGSASERERITVFSLSAAAVGVGEATGNMGGVALFNHAWALHAPGEAFMMIAVMGMAGIALLSLPRVLKVRTA